MNSMDNLLSSCPILETLELSIAPDRLARLRVPPSLKRFKFTVENNFGAYLEIDAPDLKYLSLTNITWTKWKKHILMYFPLLKMNLLTLYSISSELSLELNI
jgi:hypothetical protein